MPNPVAPDAGAGTLQVGDAEIATLALDGLANQLGLCPRRLGCLPDALLELLVSLLKNPEGIVDKRPRVVLPFMPALGTLLERYQVLIWFEDGEYNGRGLELPFIAADGKSPQECFENVREAMTAAAAHLLEQGETPPPPASHTGRTQQVNIRLSAMEKLRMEESARAKGFRGVADYLRARALAEE
ncbi:MAG TPA: type II toxin-antitoxin system HicB family antitoxin [Tepidisphaeraceae bacterium]|nr:type II toxin-antitoxin system HicB family antitoxin [Tepidisphaeraceae bacterium]